MGNETYMGIYYEKIDYMGFNTVYTLFFGVMVGAFLGYNYEKRRLSARWVYMGFLYGVLVVFSLLV